MQLCGPVCGSRLVRNPVGRFSRDGAHQFSEAG